MKRGPPSINPEAHKLYSNRAACFTKLGAYPDGVKDADECISIAPDFPKGYSRKGLLQFFMKDYDKAIATYQVQQLSASIQQGLIALSHAAESKIIHVYICTSVMIVKARLPSYLPFCAYKYKEAIAQIQLQAQEGLDKTDKDNEELKSGLQNCLMTINKVSKLQLLATDIFMQAIPLS